MDVVGTSFDTSQDYPDVSDSDGSETSSDDEDTSSAASTTSTCSNGLSDTPRCPICLNRFNTQSIGSPESCDHEFCLTCIEEWSKNVNTCPIDRLPFRLIFAKHSSTRQVYRRIAVADRINATSPTVDDDVDSILCEICGFSGQEDRLLLCDGCDRGYHLDCLDPPLVDVPAEEWFCPACAPLHDARIANGDPDYVGVPNVGNAAEAERAAATRRRAIPRTRAAERIRDRLARLVADVAADLDDDGSQSRPTVASRTPRRRKIRRRGARKGSRRKRFSRKKRKKSSKAGKSIKVGRVRLADQLGVLPPTHGHFLPRVQRRSAGGLAEATLSAGRPQLSLFGDRNELLPFDDDDDEDASLFRLDASTRLSRNARRFDRPIRQVRPSRETEQCNNANVNISNNSSQEPSNFLDSILDSQNFLHLSSKHITIRGDGKLQIKDTGSAKLKKMSQAFEENDFSGCSFVNFESGSSVDLAPLSSTASKSGVQISAAEPLKQETGGIDREISNNPPSKQPLPVAGASRMLGPRWGGGRDTFPSHSGPRMRGIFPQRDAPPPRFRHRPPFGEIHGPGPRLPNFRSHGPPGFAFEPPSRGPMMGLEGGRPPWIAEGFADHMQQTIRQRIAETEQRLESGLPLPPPRFAPPDFDGPCFGPPPFFPEPVVLPTDEAFLGVQLDPSAASMLPFIPEQVSLPTDEAFLGLLPRGPVPPPAPVMLPVPPDMSNDSRRRKALLDGGRGDSQPRPQLAPEQLYDPFSEPAVCPSDQLYDPFQIDEAEPVASKTDADQLGKKRQSNQSRWGPSTVESSTVFPGSTGPSANSAHFVSEYGVPSAFASEAPRRNTTGRVTNTKSPPAVVDMDISGDDDGPSPRRRRTLLDAPPTQRPMLMDPNIPSVPDNTQLPFHAQSIGAAPPFAPIGQDFMVQTQQPFAPPGPVGGMPPFSFPGMPPMPGMEMPPGAMFHPIPGLPPMPGYPMPFPSIIPPVVPVPVPIPVPVPTMPQQSVVQPLQTAPLPASITKSKATLSAEPVRYVSGSNSEIIADIPLPPPMPENSKEDEKVRKLKKKLLLGASALSAKSELSEQEASKEDTPKLTVQSEEAFRSKFKFSFKPNTPVDKSEITAMSENFVQAKAALHHKKKTPLDLADVFEPIEESSSTSETKKLPLPKTNSPALPPDAPLNTSMSSDMIVLSSANGSKASSADGKETKSAKADGALSISSTKRKRSQASPASRSSRSRSSSAPSSVDSRRHGSRNNRVRSSSGSISPWARDSSRFWREHDRERQRLERQSQTSEVRKRVSHRRSRSRSRSSTKRSTPRRSRSVERRGKMKSVVEQRHKDVKEVKMWRRPTVSRSPSPEEHEVRPRKRQQKSLSPSAEDVVRKSLRDERKRKKQKRAAETLAKKHSSTVVLSYDEPKTGENSPVRVSVEKGSPAKTSAAVTRHTQFLERKLPLSKPSAREQQEALSVAKAMGLNVSQVKPETLNSIARMSELKQVAGSTQLLTSPISSAESEPKLSPSRRHLPDLSMVVRRAVGLQQANMDLVSAGIEGPVADSTQPEEPDGYAPKPVPPPVTVVIDESPKKTLVTPRLDIFGESPSFSQRSNHSTPGKRSLTEDEKFEAKRQRRLQKYLGVAEVTSTTMDDADRLDALEVDESITSPLSNENDGFFDRTTSQVEQRREKLIKKVDLQLKVENAVIEALKPHFEGKKISKDEYKVILKKCVPKICKSSTRANPEKIQKFVDAYVYSATQSRYKHS